MVGATINTHNTWKRTLLYRNRVMEVHAFMRDSVGVCVFGYVTETQASGASPDSLSKNGLTLVTLFLGTEGCCAELFAKSGHIFFHTCTHKQLRFMKVCFRRI